MKHVRLLSLILVATAAAHAQSPFGWRVGPAAWSFKEFTFFEAVDKTAAVGMSYIEAFEGQRVRPDSDAVLNAELPDDMIQQIKAKLDESKVRMTSMYIHNIPTDEGVCKRTFEFARKLGLEFIVSEPAPEALDTIEKYCNEFGVNLAIHNHPEGSSRYWNPAEVLKVCEGRGPRIGACGDTGHWLRSGLKPAEAVRLLGKRLLSLHVKDLDKAALDAHDVPWGQGAGDIAGVLKAVYELRLTPGLFTVEYESDWLNNMPQIEACGAWFKEHVAALAASANREDPLYVGWATADITPEKPVSLAGQLNKRISTKVRDPLTSTALAIETRGPNGESEQAVLVSCDLVSVDKATAGAIREAVKSRAADIDTRKIVISATHTHTAPVLDGSVFKGLYDVVESDGAMKPEEYRAFFIDRVAGAIAEAWQNRAPASMNWALGSAAVGINRRAQYADGTAVMYGDTRRGDFMGFEGGADPAVQLLYFWRPDQTLTGVLINVPCPAQETEGLSEVSADFWHDVRQELHRRHDPNLFVLPQISAAGDVSPHTMFRKAAEEAMLARRGISRREEIARRIVNAVDDTLPTANKDAKSAIVLKHDLIELDLPEIQPPREPFYVTDSVHPIVCHVLRIGDAGMATNPFELFQDYGIRIQARSKPVLTFLVQLTDSNGGYLPTAKAIPGGGYSADKFIVSPEGAQLLVDTTVARLDYFWP
ncbi:MAG: TIM barrel protein [Candidatus Hydrogenedentes bacterium]|nr:TIM barrel protein [Candidatus Hydrogenedentota bacterium]